MITQSVIPIPPLNLREMIGSPELEFFDNDSFPFRRGGIPTLFTSEIDTTAAVIYDRQWFLNTVRTCGLAVRRTQHPPVAGHQWWVELERRTATSVDHFPLGDEDAEWLCGATYKPIAVPVISQEEIEKHKVAQVGPTTDPKDFLARRDPLPLTGPMAELAAVQTKFTTAQAELARIKGSWGWKLTEKLMQRSWMIKKALRME